MNKLKKIEKTIIKYIKVFLNKIDLFLIFYSLIKLPIRLFCLRVGMIGMYVIFADNFNMDCINSIETKDLCLLYFAIWFLFYLCVNAKNVILDKEIYAPFFKISTIERFDYYKRNVKKMHIALNEIINYIADLKTKRIYKVIIFTVLGVSMLSMAVMLCSVLQMMIDVYWLICMNV